MAKVDLRQAQLELDEDKQLREDINNFQWYGTDDPELIAKRKEEERNYSLDIDDLYDNYDNFKWHSSDDLYDNDDSKCHPSTENVIDDDNRYYDDFGLYDERDE